MDDDFGKYCHPQKAVEMTASGLPFVCANVGYMAQILSAQTELLYDPDSHSDLADKLMWQIEHRQVADITVNTWSQLSDQMYEVLVTAA